MYNICANKKDVIEIISIDNIPNITCTVETLPDDIYTYMLEGKYRANSSGLYIVNNWVDLTNEQLAIRNKSLMNNTYNSNRLPYWKYFIVPLEIIPQVSHYSYWVKKTYPELSFNYALNRSDVLIEGEIINLPTNTIQLIPCGVTHWINEGLQILDAVIELWNVDNPNKMINFNYKFESYDELNKFISENR